MPHYEQIAFVREVKRVFPDRFVKGKVLEIGSAGSGAIRALFESSSYTGVDIAQADGVDVVISGHAYDGGGDTFDVCLSCESFEHNPFWMETFINMIRLARPGGMVLFTCASPCRGEHGTTRSAPSASLSTQIGWDYYKNLTAYDFASRINLSMHFSSYRFYRNKISEDLYFIGFKKGGDQDLCLDKDFESIEDRVHELSDLSSLSTLRVGVLYAKRILHLISGSEARYQDLIHYGRLLKARVMR